MRRKLLLPVFFIICCFQNSYAQDQAGIQIGSEYLIRSNILSEQRQYFVSLPASYHTTKNRYPVMVISDGDYRFYQASGLLEFLSKQNRIPEMILIGVANTDRTRDLTPTPIDNNASSGGADSFLRFIEDELLVQVDKMYRTNSYRLLAGHSLGGLFSVHAFLENSDFDAFIATDPSLWWDNQIILDDLKDKLVDTGFRKRIYLSSADNYERNEGMVSYMRRGHELFYARLKSLGFPQANVKLGYFLDEDHGTSAYISLYYGLLFVYDPFRLDDIYNRSSSEIQNHYNQLTERTSSDFIPPENLINDIAQFRLRNEELETAIELLRMNANNYGSYESYVGLGDALARASKKEEAQSYYEKALEINPGKSSEIEEKMNELR
ncbi:alpha/beta hydrolase-fold protein [Muricauda sp. ANG21]|uniref:alpha/beta hydrolase-fold protein n=1 Tax=Allomuricauda sp. ANG21 TaxID=3042468 RepID=UPI003453FC98